MPWIPEDAPHNLLASVSASQWKEWADGGSFSIAPHRRPPTAFACRVIRDVTHPSGILFKKGMEGQYLGMSTQFKDMAIIFIQGVTEGDGFTNRTIPRRCLELGKPWRADLRDWNLSVDLITKTFNTSSWGGVSLPDTTVLGRTIVRLVTALIRSPPPFSSPKLLHFLESLNVAAACRKIIQGVKDAGLYTLLSSTQSFNVKAIIDNAKIKVTGISPSSAGGIYSRFHVSNNKVTLWKKNASYVYVGKTNDFRRRHNAHKTATTSYGQLTRNSARLSMVALCLLQPSEEEGLYFLAEQVFVCLLQTYRPSVLTASAINADFLKHVQTAKYFTDLANEVFHFTGWQGGVARGKASFDAEYGANCSSPLLELGSKYDKFLYIRTDADIKDVKTGQVVPMAFYQRSITCKVDINRGKNRDTTLTTIRLAKYTNNDRKVLMTVSFPIASKKKVPDFPLPGTPYRVVIEVCKDGSKHPFAWARLPDIGGFENFTQANSFAVRIEWQHPPESGNWNFNYARAGFLWKMIDDNIPGSLPTVPSCARVLQTKYDWINQSIKFQEQINDIPMLSGRALSPNAIKNLMSQPKYGLKDVGAQFGGNFTGARGSASTHRSRCDTCLLLQDKKQDVPSTCVQHQNTHGCTNCVKVFGRPICSYTADLKSFQFVSQSTRSPEQKVATTIAMNALVCQELTPPVLTPFRQTLRQLESSEQLEDDASDVESDDETDDELS